MIRVWLARLREWLRRNDVDRDLRDELESHVAHLSDDYRRRGLDPSAARVAAVRDLGGLDRSAEAIRDQRGWPSFELLIRDVRHAVLLLRKAPAFTGVAVLTLALGMGVNTAIFSVVDAVMLRPLPYPDPGALVSIWEGMIGAGPDSNTSSGTITGQSASAGLVRETVSPANLVDYRRDVRSVQHMASYDRIGLNLTGRGMPDRVFGEQVTWNYFEVLATPPALGRAFLPDDDVAGAPPVVVLSDALWRQRFGGDPGVLHQTMILDGTAHTIIGVMPATLTAVSSVRRADTVSFWITSRFPPDLLANHGDHEVNVVARLAPGASIARAQAELSATSERLAREFPQESARVRAVATPLREDLVGSVRTSLIILLTAVGVVLLIACVNVANLLIVRSVSRRREVALRLALGATRGRVVRELLVQSLVLSLLAALAALALAAVTKGLIVSAAPSSMPRLDGVGLDWRALAFTGAVALLTGIVFGILPAWQAARTQPFATLGAGSRVVAGSWVMRWRGALIVVEIALSTVLLVGAGLMVRSLVALNGVDLGFRTDRVLAFNVNLPETRYATGDQRYAFFADLTSRLSRLPHVQAAGVANRLPLRGGWETGVQLDTMAPDAPSPDVGFQAVTPGYFAALDFRLVRGRLLTDADRNGAEAVAVVSDAFGRELLGGADPIGHRLRRGPRAPWITVVGVIADIRRDGQARRGDVHALPIKPQAYLSAAQTSLYPTRLADVALRLDESAADAPMVSIVPQVRDTVLGIDGELPITNVRTLDSIVEDNAGERRFQALLFVLFAGLALALALVGLMGVVSYAIAQRTPEIGVRMALGADRARILRWVVGQSLGVVLGGALAGVAAAFVLSRFISSLLFEVAPSDPLTYAAAATGLATFAIGASLLAGRAATSIDPVRALRQD
jgi:putative ABC transport system permease protein